MKSKELTSRIAERSDMTRYLTHLTKPLVRQDGTVVKNTIDTLLQILEDKKIKGSTTESGYICGNIPAVCFQDTPLYQLSQNAYYEQKLKSNRYKGCGLMFSKNLVYKKGGRPVVYENKEVAKRILPPSEYWRIVNFDLSDNENIIDWTHEREWRVPNEFVFSLETVTIILPNTNVVNKFIKKYKAKFGSDPIEDLPGGIIPLQKIFF